ncbi:hypothetical protein KIN20_028015 [Parelaphostrongylus tenuis]|uniref:Uncharacterized protein n=1 Tax=Parelaphostrongylus tenuis TaxID=148309 RepID=A0AAD5WEC5_PARTN|nr:hypothetical protein KIN20_028015 [Parelaphostrongylus tenuis]
MVVIVLWANGRQRMHLIKYERKCSISMEQKKPQNIIQAAGNTNDFLQFKARKLRFCLPMVPTNDNPTA